MLQEYAQVTLIVEGERRSVSTSLTWWVESVLCFIYLECCQSYTLSTCLRAYVTVFVDFDCHRPFSQCSILVARTWWTASLSTVEAAPTKGPENGGHCYSDDNDNAFNDAFKSITDLGIVKR